MIPLFGQSNLDLCIQITGGLDNFIIFCNNNNVTDVNIVKNYYSTTSNQLINALNVGYSYATKNTNKEGSGDYSDLDYDSSEYST